STLQDVSQPIATDTAIAAITKAFAIKINWCEEGSQRGRCAYRVYRMLRPFSRACRTSAGPCSEKDRAHSDTFDAAGQAHDLDSPATRQTLLPEIHGALTPATVGRSQATDRFRRRKMKAAR